MSKEESDFKYNIGDIVSVIDNGEVYSTFQTMFQSMGFTEPNKTSKLPAGKDRKYIIFNRGPHITKSISLYALRLLDVDLKQEDNTCEILISQEGIELFKQVEAPPVNVGDVSLKQNDIWCIHLTPENLPHVNAWRRKNNQDELQAGGWLFDIITSECKAYGIYSDKPIGTLLTLDMFNALHDLKDDTASNEFHWLIEVTKDNKDIVVDYWNRMMISNKVEGYSEPEIGNIVTSKHPTDDSCYFKEESRFVLAKAAKQDGYQVLSQYKWLTTEEFRTLLYNPIDLKSTDNWMVQVTPENHDVLDNFWYKHLVKGVTNGWRLPAYSTLLSKHHVDDSYFYNRSVDQLKEFAPYKDYKVLTYEQWRMVFYKFL